jgi:hypothetical protein
MGDLKSKVAAELEAFWEEQAGGPTGAGEGVDDLVAAMDSFTATEVLEGIERLVGMELPSGDVIRRGGYDSKEQFVEELSAQIVQYVQEHTK